MAYLTLQWMSNNYDIWKNFVMPVGVNTETVILVILQHCGTNCVRYPDPNYMQQEIGVWCVSHNINIKRMFDTIDLDYNPIENYNMSDTITEKHSGTDTTNHTLTNNLTDKEKGTDNLAKNGSRKLQNAGTDTNTVGVKETLTKNGQRKIVVERGQQMETNVRSKKTGSEIYTDTDSISSYNTSSLQVKNRREHDQTIFPQEETNTHIIPGLGSDEETETFNNYSEIKTPTGSNTVQYGKTETETFSGYSDNRTKDLIYTKEGTQTNKNETIHGHNITTTTKRTGNIGVTTSQQMIEQERKLNYFNLYTWIANMFEEEFTICVY